MRRFSRLPFIRRRTRREFPALVEFAHLRRSGGLDAAASQFEAFVIFAVVEAFAAARARDGTPVAAAARKFGKTVAARVNPTRSRRGQSDSVTRFGLPDFSRFEAKLSRMAAWQGLNVKPQMNHFVLEDFAQSLLAVAAHDPANRIFGTEKRSGAVSCTFKSLDQQRNRQLDEATPHVDVARRARQLAAPNDAARRQNVIEIKRVDLLIKRL